MPEPIQHGGGLDRAMACYGGARADWLDLSTGINPHPYPVPTLDGDVWARLPDTALVKDAVAAARRYYGVDDTVAVLPVAGAQAAIQCLSALLPHGGTHIVEPCYGEYAHVLGRSNMVPLAEARAIVLANPNNPDGVQHDETIMSAWLAEGKTLIIDEAFCDVSPERSLIGLASMPNVLVMKSFGKFFGLAGVRLGFVMGDATMIGQIERQLGPWSVSGPALAIGAQAMADAEWIAESRHWLAGQRAALEAALAASGFVPVGATDLFVTVQHPRASQLAEVLAENHILVRAFDYAPTWLRFGFPPDDVTFDRLKQVLASAM